MCLFAAGPVTRLLGSVEDQRSLAEHEVWSGTLAVSKQRRVKVDAEESQVGVGLDARVGLGRSAAGTDATATVAHTSVRDRASGRQGNADTITTAGVGRAGIDTLALETSETDRAVATELT